MSDTASVKAIAFFESASEKKIDRLLQEPARFDWEREKCSLHSPGPVSCEEDLRRQLAHPVFIDQETGEIKVAAFNDVFQHGMSVERSSFWSEEEAIARAQMRTREYNDKNPDPAKQRVFVAFAVLNAGKIRAEIAGQRMLGVYDTALPDVVAHADVCMIAEKSELNKRRARTRLQEITTTEFLAAAN